MQATETQASTAGVAMWTTFLAGLAAYRERFRLEITAKVADGVGQLAPGASPRLHGSAAAPSAKFRSDVPKPVVSWDRGVVERFGASATRAESRLVCRVSHTVVLHRLPMKLDAPIFRWVMLIWAVASVS